MSQGKAPEIIRTVASHSIAQYYSEILAPASQCVPPPHPPPRQNPQSCYLPPPVPAPNICTGPVRII